jgi:hypothetical protein
MDKGVKRGGKPAFDSVEGHVPVGPSAVHGLIGHDFSDGTAHLIC